MKDSLDAVAYCGLACLICSETDPEGANCPGCRAGGGEAGCHQRLCCKGRGIDGCWQCDDFPCDEGFATDGHDPAFRGFWVASVRAVREHGLDRYVALVREKMGECVDHADYRCVDALKITAMLTEGRGPRAPD